MADQLLQQQQEYVEQSHQVNNELIAELMNLGWTSVRHSLNFGPSLFLKIPRISNNSLKFSKIFEFLIIFYNSKHS